MESLLDFLVTSQARKKVLSALWNDRMARSVSEFSVRLNLSYASTYDELKRMESLGLAKSHYLGAKHLFELNLDHPYKEVIESLLSYQPPTNSKESAAQSLEHFQVDKTLSFLAQAGGGAVAPNQESEGIQWSLEEGLVMALRASHINPTIARDLPLVLFKNWMELDLAALKHQASKAGEKRTLGFFLDLTSELAPKFKKELKREASSLQDRRFKKKQSFFVEPKKGRFLKRLEEEKTPSVAKKWQYTMNMEVSSFRSHFNKFTH
jgi:hypothetical protein